MSDKEFTMILGSLRRSLEELSRWIARASTARNNEVYDAEHVLHRLSVAACGVFELTEQAIAMTSAEASDHLLSIRHALEDLEALGIGHGARPSASLPSVVLNAIPDALAELLARSVEFIKQEEQAFAARTSERAEVLRAMEQGVFLEFVKRNPGKGSLARMPAFRENVSFDVNEGIEESWTDCAVFEYPNDRWVIGTTYRHWVADWLPDDTQYEEISPGEAAVRLLNSDIPWGVDDLVRLKALAASAQPNLPKIEWDRDRAELRIGEQIARSFKKPKQAKQVTKVLDVFQEDSWPERIDSPFSPDETGKQTLRDTVRSLNDGAVGIRFLADGTGEGIRFQLTHDENPPDQAENDPPF